MPFTVGRRGDALKALRANYSQSSPELAIASRAGRQRMLDAQSLQLPRASESPNAALPVACDAPTGEDSAA